MKSTKGRKPQVKEVRKMIKAELKRNLEPKYNMFYNNSLGIDTTGNVSEIISNSQGSTDVAHIGDQIELSSIYFNYYVTNADTTNIVRVVLIQTRGYTPSAAADIFQVSGSDSVLTSPYHHDVMQTGLLTVLYDRLHCLDTYNPLQQHKGWIPMKYVKNKVQFDAGSSDVLNGDLYLITISDSSAVSHPTINVNVLYNYTDA